jgi:Cu2+-containing amine oxidase
MNPQKHWPGLLAVLASLAPCATHGAANHPLDALDASEITTTTAILRNSGNADDKSLIASISLH